MKKNRIMALVMAVVLLLAAAVPVFAEEQETAAAKKSGLVTESGAQHYYDNGKLVKDKPVIKIGKKYYRIDKNGAVTQWKGTEAKAAKQLEKIKAVPKNSKAKTLNKSLKKAFLWSAQKIQFRNITLKASKKKALKKFAQYGFENGSGDCVAQAATFCMMAKVLGYEASLVQGFVPQAVDESGKPTKFGTHAWVEIKTGSKTYVYDPNFNMTYHKSLKKMAGYKVRYGAKNTYRYFNTKKKEIKKK